MVAFLVPSVVAAVVLLAEHVAGVGGITRFPHYVSGDLANMLLGIIAYLPVMAIVPIALLLLARTGQPPSKPGSVGPAWSPTCSLGWGSRSQPSAARSSSSSRFPRCSCTTRT